ILTLQWHPVRLFSSLERKYYYGAKKKVLDRVASRYLRKGSFQFTWDHFRRRVSEAYRAAMAIRQPQLV
ncbi:MAG TPA: hypothetical protein VJX28_08780, partial [Chthoniobacterales bacterium]|nr:hypothetical protein [Chthoniobacterales bacterium]